MTRLTKWFSRSVGECNTAIWRNDSTALSLTTVSSTVANDSKGGYKLHLLLIYAIQLWQTEK